MRYIYSKIKSLTKHSEKMKKNLIKEDIQKMMGLIGYDRGKTLTENKESNKSQLLNEIFPALAAYAALGAGVYKGWQWAVDAWGSKSIDARITDALDQTTWPKINKAIRETEKATGEDIEGKFDVVSASEAKRMANDLNAAFDYTFGTDEDKIGDTFADMGSFMDLARVSYEYSDRPDGDLAYELDDELSQSDFKTYVSNNMKSKPLAIFDGKSYDSLEKLLTDIAEMAKPAKTEGGTGKFGKKMNEMKMKVLKAKFNDYPCVQAEIEKAKEISYPYNKKVDRVLITSENGDLLLVATSGKYTAKIGGQKSTGTIECPDDLRIEDEEELTITEGRYIFEQSFGGIKLKPTSKPEDKTGSDEDKKSSGGGGSSYTRTDLDYMDVTSCNGEVKRGDRGQVVKDIQSKLNESPKVEPKLKVDGIFGSKTEAAIKQVGGTNVFDCKLAKALDAETNKPEDNVASKEVTKQDENEIDKVTIEKEKVDPNTLQDQIDDLKNAISKQPTKEACKELIGTAAAGIKKGVRLNDTSSLAQCYNSYNFGLMKGSRTVKKAYGLKGKGN